jgi:hypothetical protein
MQSSGSGLLAQRIVYHASGQCSSWCVGNVGFQVPQTGLKIAGSTPHGTASGSGEKKAEEGGIIGVLATAMVLVAEAATVQGTIR